MRRQSPLRMAVFRPRIGEVEVNAVYLALSKHFRKLACIHADKEQVFDFRLQFFPFLYCAEQHAVVHFNADVVDFRMQNRHIHQKAALSHTDLNMNRIFISKNFSPPSPAALRLLHNERTGSNHIF